jgi:hypothetical protein
MKQSGWDSIFFEAILFVAGIALIAIGFKRIFPRSTK